MNPFVFSARSRHGDEAYLPLEQLGIAANVAARNEGEYTVTLTNPGAEAWEGVIRMTLPVMENARFFLPGFMYGTNRGEAPLVVDSPCPRIRESEEFPASPWWMVRSDRLSHPVAMAYGHGRLVGITASPYFVHQDGCKVQWQPGMAGDFCQYAGFGCDLSQGVSYTLGYENAPWMFVQSHTVNPRAPMGENCFVLAAGESVSVRIHVIDRPAVDEREVYAALREVYDLWHQAPRKVNSIRKTVEDIATAIARDAWLPEMNSYTCFVFDREDGYEYRALPSIAWTNGLEGTPNELKLKFLADNDFAHLSGDELKEAISGRIKEKDGSSLVGKMESEGTTPRQLTDLIGSLCDLTSGSGDKGTPVVLIQGYFDNYTN